MKRSLFLNLCPGGFSVLMMFIGHWAGFQIQIQVNFEMSSYHKPLNAGWFSAALHRQAVIRSVRQTTIPSGVSRIQLTEKIIRGKWRRILIQIQPLTVRNPLNRFNFKVKKCASKNLTDIFLLLLSVVFAYSPWAARIKRMILNRPWMNTTKKTSRKLFNPFRY